MKKCEVCDGSGVCACIVDPPPPPHELSNLADSDCERCGGSGECEGCDAEGYHFDD